jgi:hypothetical protein
MLYGDKTRFAIEWQLDNNDGGVWLLGRVCYFLNGQRVGDWGLGTSLRDVLFRWERIVCDADNRINPRLSQLAPKDLWNTVHFGMFGGKATEQQEQQAIEEQWANHDITPPLTCLTAGTPI